MIQIQMMHFIQQKKGKYKRILIVCLEVIVNPLHGWKNDINVKWVIERILTCQLVKVLCNLTKRSGRMIVYKLVEC